MCKTRIWCFREPRQCSIIRTVSSLVTTKALVVCMLLLVAVLAALCLTRGTEETAEHPGPDSVPAAARDASIDVFMGCLGQTGSDAFSLAVSRVLPTDPLRIETYGLVGSGGLRLSDHVGHTIEVTGALEEAGDAFPHLRASSARHVSTECWRP